jgi:hypothetical protein
VIGCAAASEITTPSQSRGVVPAAAPVSTPRLIVASTPLPRAVTGDVVITMRSRPGPIGLLAMLWLPVSAGPPVTVPRDTSAGS